MQLSKLISLYIKGMLAESLKHYCQQIWVYIPITPDIVGTLTLLHVQLSLLSELSFILRQRFGMTFQIT